MSRDHYETVHALVEKPSCAVCLLDVEYEWQAKEAATTVFGTAVCGEHVQRAFSMLTLALPAQNAVLFKQKPIL